MCCSNVYFPYIQPVFKLVLTAYQRCFSCRCHFNQHRPLASLELQLSRTWAAAGVKFKKYGVPDMLKRIVLASLSLALLSGAVVPSAFARTSPYGINPFGLVNLARNGMFRDQGVPGFGRLSAGHQAGRITAEDVIQAAIADGRLSSAALNDTRYVRSVEQQLRDLDGRC